MNLKLLPISAVFFIVGTIMFGIRGKIDIMIEIVYAAGILFLLGAVVVKDNETKLSVSNNK